MYTIDTKIPAPGNSGRGRAPKYPFKTMKVGHSFFVPNTDNPKSAVVCACYDQRKSTRKYQSAADTVNGVAGTRIWRKK